MTWKLPLVQPAGTRKVKLALVAVEAEAMRPFITIQSAPGEGSNHAPSMETVAPGRTATGETLASVGARTGPWVPTRLSRIVKMRPLLVPKEVVTLSKPEVAPSGRTMVSWVAEAAVTVTAMPARAAVLSAMVGPKLIP